MLKHGSPGLQLRGTDVMLSAIQHDPAPLRQFMRSQKDHELFHLLVRYFCICQTHHDGRSMCFAVTSAHVVACVVPCGSMWCLMWWHVVPHVVACGVSCGGLWCLMWWHLVSCVVCGLSPDLWFSTCSALFACLHPNSCTETGAALSVIKDLELSCISPKT